MKIKEKFVFEKWFIVWILFLILFLLMICGCNQPRILERNTDKLIVREICTVNSKEGNEYIYFISSEKKVRNAFHILVEIQTTNIYQIGQTVYIR